MSIFLTVGVTHEDATLDQLEQVAANVADRATTQARALAEGCAEAMVLATCSRIELHAVLDLPDDDGPANRKACWVLADRLISLLVRSSPQPVGRVAVAVGDDAVRHLFAVAAGLGSRLTGETEVQAQLRVAARAAAARDGEPHRLRRAVTAALKAARATSRQHPALLRRGLLAERAVARVLEHGRADGPVEAIVVGAGAMGRQVAQALPLGRSRATLLSRTTSARGAGPRVLPLTELAHRLADADVVFVATSAGRHILSTELVAAAVAARPGRPLTIVDLSLPRNVDPAVTTVPGVRLLDLDDLGDAGSGVVPDRGQLAAAAAATEAAADDYCGEIRSRMAGPLISALRVRVEEVCAEQLRRTSRGLDLPEEALQRMAAAVAGAVAHSPTLQARQAGAEGDEATLALLAAAFGLTSRTTAREVA